MNIKDMEKRTTYKTNKDTKDGVVKAGTVIWMDEDGKIYIPDITGDRIPSGTYVSPEYTEKIFDGVTVELCSEYHIEKHRDCSGIIVANVNKTT